MICLEQHPNFQIQTNSKIVFAILLHVENVQNRHVCIVPLAKRLNQYFFFKYQIDLSGIKLNHVEFQT